MRNQGPKLIHYGKFSMLNEDRNYVINNVEKNFYILIIEDFLSLSGKYLYSRIGSKYKNYPRSMLETTLIYKDDKLVGLAKKEFTNKIIIIYDPLFIKEIKSNEEQTTIYLNYSKKDEKIYVIKTQKNKFNEMSLEEICGDFNVKWIK